MARANDDLENGNPLSYLQLAVPSGAAQTLTNGVTIAHNGAPAVRLTTGGAVTGIIVAIGLYLGQFLFLQNEAANTITMATAATSNVFGGTAIVLPASRSAMLRWEAATALWYCCFSG